MQHKINHIVSFYKHTLLIILVVSENIKGQLEWLRTHKDPFEDVKARWEATHEVRVEMLRTSTQTIFDYINEFSVLQLSTGYTLVIMFLKRINDLNTYLF